MFHAGKAMDILLCIKHNFFVFNLFTISLSYGNPAWRTFLNKIFHADADLSNWHPPELQPELNKYTFENEHKTPQNTSTGKCIVKSIMSESNP